MNTLVNLAGLGIGFPEQDPSFMVEHTPEVLLQNTYELQNVIQSQQEAAAQGTPTASVTPETAEDVLKGMRRLSFLARLPGAYDYGLGSNKRNRDYAGLGDHMHGLYAMDRPTMGFDIWSAVAQGAKKGIAEYKADPNKAPLPKLNLPKISTGLTAPAWLKQTVKAVSKPVSTVGKNVLSSVQAAKAKDRREAEAQAAAQGMTIPPEPEPQKAGVSPSAVLALAGLALIGIGVVKMRRA